MRRQVGTVTKEKVPCGSTKYCCKAQPEIREKSSTRWKQACRNALFSTVSAFALVADHTFVPKMHVSMNEHAIAYALLSMLYGIAARDLRIPESHAGWSGFLLFCFSVKLYKISNKAAILQQLEGKKTGNGKHCLFKVRFSRSSDGIPITSCLRKHLHIIHRHSPMLKPIVAKTGNPNLRFFLVGGSCITPLETIFHCPTKKHEFPFEKVCFF